MKPVLPNQAYEYIVVIPARYASTRLPGKVLLEIAGKPMLQHVYERALESGASQVVIATDDHRIAEAAQGWGATVCMTSPDHPNGTSRIAEVIDQYHYSAETIIVNLQGDEPLIPPAYIQKVAHDLANHPEIQVSTLCAPIDTLEKVFDPTLVKVDFDQQQRALYFSRAPIPWDRIGFQANPKVLSPNVQYWGHIGLYASRAGFISHYAQSPAMPLENSELLEQLRILEQGGAIYVGMVDSEKALGVDTPEDLARVRQLFEK